MKTLKEIQNELSALTVELDRLLQEEEKQMTQDYEDSLIDQSIARLEDAN